MTTNLRQCNQCGLYKELHTCFAYRKERGTYYKTCRVCRSERWRSSPAYTASNLRATERYRQNKDKARSERYMRKYGLTLEDYTRMLKEQGHVCKICKRPPKDARDRLVVDHSHSTGLVRGLLCYHCNVLLGLAGDDIFIIQRAIEYIKANSEL